MEGDLANRFNRQLPDQAKWPPAFYSPKTGVYASKHPPRPLPQDPHQDLVSFLFSHPHCGTTALVDSASGSSITYRQLHSMVSSVASGNAAARTWKPVMTADTTNPYYWLNWRFLLCSAWILIGMGVASFLIWRYEGRGGGRGEDGREAAGALYADEAWRPCLKAIHPAWLLAFRVVAFFLLLALLVVNAVVDGGGTFYYYTQWTFVLVTIYFGLGSLLSFYGCLQYIGMMGVHIDSRIRTDAECGTFVSPANEDNRYISPISETGGNKSSGSHQEHNIRKVAGFWVYVFQIIYQTNAGAVMLTDCVFWLIIFPFLAIKDYEINLILIGMHSVNAVFLLGDIALNNLRFPWFRIAYFLLWTSGFVIFQWILHACTTIWWPYPFLELSSPQAPVWYFAVALMHVPCYAVFPFIMKLKRIVLSRYFRQYLPAN